MAVLFSDTFTRPDGTLHGSTSDSGHTWDTRFQSTSSDYLSVKSGQLDRSGTTGTQYARVTPGAGTRWSAVTINLPAVWNGGSIQWWPWFDHTTGRGVGLYLSDTATYLIVDTVNGTPAMPIATAFGQTKNSVIAGAPIRVEVALDEADYLRVRVNDSDLIAEPASPDIKTLISTAPSHALVLSTSSAVRFDNLVCDSVGPAAPLLSPPPPSPEGGEVLGWDRFSRVADGMLHGSLSDGDTRWDTRFGGTVQDYLAVRSQRLDRTTQASTQRAQLPLLATGVKYGSLTINFPATWNGGSIQWWPWFDHTTGRGVGLYLSDTATYLIVDTLGGTPTMPTLTVEGLVYPSLIAPGVTVQPELFVSAGVMYLRVGGAFIFAEPLDQSVVDFLPTTSYMCLQISGSSAITFDDVLVTSNGPAVPGSGSGGEGASGWAVGCILL